MCDSMDYDRDLVGIGSVQRQQATHPDKVLVLLACSAVPAT